MFTEAKQTLQLHEGPFGIAHFNYQWINLYKILKLQHNYTHKYEILLL
jgi:hypothetical protein